MIEKRLLAIKSLLLWILIATVIKSATCQIRQPPSTTSGKRVLTRVREKQILDRILSSNNKYDTNIRPSGGASETGETQVTVNLMVNSISKIDDFNMEYKAQLTLRMEWNDDRLNYSDQDPLKTIKYLTISDQKRIWMPDVFFINEKDGHFHNIIMPNVLIRIFPDGKVSISIRMSLTLSCPMDLKLFPMDTQTCSVVMASYAWTTDDLVFNWREQDAVQLPNLSLPRFSLKETKTSKCDRHTVTGTYSCIRVDFTLNRNFSYYLTQMYIPCIMLVIVSWVSFWLDENAVPARTALGITT